MNVYWIYDLQNWQFYLLTVSCFICFSLLGSFVVNKYLEKLLNITQESNNIIGIFLSISGVFYGITLGLIAVGTFDNFKKAEDIVMSESSALAALYRDVSILEQPEKEVLLKELKNYTRFTIQTDWPLQRKGIISSESVNIVNTFQQQFAKYIPETSKDAILYREVFDQYNVFIEARRNRLSISQNNLPGTVWFLIIIGAIINIILLWLLHNNNKRLDIALNILNGLLLGSLIFLIASMDNPLRGEYSVGTEMFQSLLNDIMK